MTGRNEYRVRQRRRFLTVLCAAPDGIELEGDVQDLSMSGCGCVFDRGAAESLAVDTPVALTFQALLLTDTLRVDATVKRVDGGLDGCEVGFAFSAPETLRDQVPYVLLREFNRRAAERTTMDHLIEVSVRLERPDRPGRHSGSSDWKASFLCDLSAGGVGLRPSGDLESELGVGAVVHLRFRLPGIARVFDLAGKVCSVRRDGLATVCGVEFLPEASEDYDLQHADLRAYVASDRAAGAFRSLGDAR